MKETEKEKEKKGNMGREGNGEGGASEVNNRCEQNRKYYKII